MSYCAFQYATDDGVVFENKCFLTNGEANNLFDEYLPKFVKHHEEGRRPEMAIWINMESDSDYGETQKHYHADDFEVRDGELYQITRIKV